MPAETEVFKLVIQLGSFGLLAIAVIWMLYYGAPMIRDTVKSLGESHVKAMEAIAVRLEKIEEQHTHQLQHLDTNCREERLAMAKLLANTMPAKTSG